MGMITTHWFASRPADLVVLAGYLAVAAAHLAGLRRLTAGRPSRRELIVQAAVFQLGLLIAALAMVSPVGYWSTVYVWIHGLQDLLLAFLAPTLIVLGAPWQALWQALCQALRWPGRVPRPADLAPSSRWWLVSPVAAAVAFNAVWLGWHLPALFDSTRGSALATLAECACYLGAGVLFWLQLIGSRPSSPVASPLGRFALLTAAVITSTILGMTLVFGSGVFYPAYAPAAAHHLMSVVADQQLAGAVLWMGMLPQAVVAAVAVLIRWLDDEESAELSAGFDRLLTRRRSAWPSRPGLR